MIIFCIENYKYQYAMIIGSQPRSSYQPSIWVHRGVNSRSGWENVWLGRPFHGVRRVYLPSVS